MNNRLVVLGCVVLCSGCSGISASRRKAWEESAAPAVTALQASRFDEATSLAKNAIAQDGENSRANAALAIAEYKKTMHDLFGDAISLGGAVALAGATGQMISTDTLMFAFKRADERLGQVDAELAVAAKDPEVSIELCLACWEVDWNRSGEIDERDQTLFQIEQDAEGKPLAEGDPKRKPTYRFDNADVHWLKALIAFQRSAVALAQGWDWAALAPAFTRRGHKEQSIHIPVRDAAQVKKARDFILVGVAESRACRDAALAEGDDDREWLPNPRQKHYAMPLEVDDALYATWSEVLDDTEKLVRGETALSVSQLAQLGEKQWKEPPQGYLQIGKWLSEPREIVIPMKDLDANRAEQIEKALQSLFGDAFSQAGTASQLPVRLTRMKSEVSLGKESFERKLRYLLWIN